MIQARTNREQFQYDIHSLLKAFFPEEEVRVQVVTAEEETQEPREEFADAPCWSVFFREAESRVQITYSYGDGQVRVKEAEYTKALEMASLTQANASTNGSKASLQTPKNAMKQALYLLLTEVSGRSLPWGALTGIRPTKIALQLLEKDKDEKEIKNYLKNVYYVSDTKIDLSLEIAYREKKVLDLHPYQTGYSLYVGIPFCPTRCHYCSFAGVPLGGNENLVEPYLASLRRELTATADLMAGKRLDTLYIGGGTPTALNASQLDELISHIKKVFDMRDVREFTVEAGRPDSVLDDTLKLRLLHEQGVNRICINPQTFVQKTLDTIGRCHSVEQTKEAYLLARTEGFDNINMDLIIGLPGEGMKEAEITAEQVRRLRPDDLTLHSLAVKRGSRLQARMSEQAEAARNGKEVSAASKDLQPVRSDSRSVAEVTGMMDLLTDTARSLSLFPYYLYRQKNMTGNMENTGYAREGAEGLTNILGMEDVHSIVAVGAGAVTKRVYEKTGEETGRITRCGNVREVAQYISRVDEMTERKRELFSRE